MVSLKKISTKMLMVIGLAAAFNMLVDVSLCARTPQRSLSSNEIEEIQHIIKVIEDQKSTINKALSDVAIKPVKVDVTDQVINHVGYIAGAAAIAWLSASILNEKLIKITSFLVSYAALVVLFAYLLPESGGTLQKESLEKAREHLVSHQETLKKIVARGELPA